MPKESYPRDRFDDLPSDPGRVGAHSAENPRMRAGLIFLWALIATIVLIVLGIFGTLVAGGKITLFPTPAPTITPLPVITPVIDTTYSVIVLNATPEEGLAASVRDQILAAGWSPESVVAGGAGSTDFATTTVYYALPQDEAAAAGLAEAIGGADIEQNAIYQPADDPEARQLAVVVGLDRTANPPAPTPTP